MKTKVSFQLEDKKKGFAWKMAFGVDFEGREKWEMMKKDICPKWHKEKHRLEKSLSIQFSFIEVGRLERKVRTIVMHSSC